MFLHRFYCSRPGRPKFILSSSLARILSSCPVLCVPRAHALSARCIYLERACLSELQRQKSMYVNTHTALLQTLSTRRHASPCLAHSPDFLLSSVVVPVPAPVPVPVPGRSENSGADVDAEAQAPDQPAGDAGGQHGAGSDGAQRRLEAHQGPDARQVRLVEYLVSKGCVCADGGRVGGGGGKNRDQMCCLLARTRGRGLLSHCCWWTNIHV